MAILKGASHRISKASSSRSSILSSLNSNYILLVVEAFVMVPTQVKCHDLNHFSKYPHVLFAFAETILKSLYIFKAMLDP